MTGDILLNSSLIRSLIRSLTSNSDPGGQRYYAVRACPRRAKAWFGNHRPAHGIAPCNRGFPMPPAAEGWESAEGALRNAPGSRGVAWDSAKEPFRGNHFVEKRNGAQKYRSCGEDQDSRGNHSSRPLTRGAFSLSSETGHRNDTLCPVK